MTGYDELYKILQPSDEIPPELRTEHGLLKPDLLPFFLNTELEQSKVSEKRGTPKIQHDKRQHIDTLAIIIFACYDDDFREIEPPEELIDATHISRKRDRFFISGNYVIGLLPCTDESGAASLFYKMDKKIRERKQICIAGGAKEYSYKRNRYKPEEWFEPIDALKTAKAYLKKINEGSDEQIKSFVFKSSSMAPYESQLLLKL